jgi:hypothetical protein
MTGHVRRLIQRCVLLALAGGMAGGCYVAPPHYVPARSVPRPMVSPGPPLYRQLPPDYVTLVVEGTTYYFQGGFYFRMVPGGYIVVDAPLVRVLPPGHVRVVIDDVEYYRAGSAYYRRHGKGYTVVPPPHRHRRMPMRGRDHSPSRDRHRSPTRGRRH